jgi:hypothetical protein
MCPDCEFDTIVLIVSESDAYSKMLYPAVPIDQCPFRPTDAARKAHLHTPRIKQMAEEGQILSNFYSPRST